MEAKRRSTLRSKRQSSLKKLHQSRISKMVSYYEEEKDRIKNSKARMTIRSSYTKYQTNESTRVNQSEVTPYQDK